MSVHPLRCCVRGWLLIVAVCAVSGCGEATSAPKFETISGKVAKCVPETGELIVELPPGVRVENESRLLHCVLTRDSEVYVNDRAATPRDLLEGDALDLVIYRDPNPTLTSFVATYAFVRRPMPAARPPEFLSQASRAATGPATSTVPP